MTRRPQRSRTPGSGSSGDAEPAPSSSPRSVRHPLGSPRDPLADAGDGHFVLVDGQLVHKSATPVDAPPPYAPYRARAQSYTTGRPVALPPLPAYHEPTEATPLLAPSGPTRSTLAFVLQGDEAGYWAALRDGAAWRALTHLLLINFPFNLALWPLLLAGTVVGTALLLTLPLGAVFWFATLLLARAGANAELALQARFHGVQPRPARPVFYRARVRGDGVLVRDTRLLTCSWAMFSDPHSYAALVYLLLIKPAVVLASGLGLLVLFIVCAVLFPLLPVCLRVARTVGLWQARLALDNL